MSPQPQVYITLGTGGVGKTSIAASLACYFAKLKKRTLVVTIDPSQRLKTTLQLKEQGENQVIESPQLGGYLSACLLDSKYIFDDFIRRGLKNEELAQKLIKNRLYQQLSTTLNGSQEFTALEKLLFEFESGQWDVIILDTPPAGHAIDFLRAPQKLNRLLDERIAKWFRSPKDGGTFIGGLFQFGTRNLMKALELLTGGEFMKELSDFFDQIQFWQTKLEARLSRVQSLLSSQSCHFILVTTYDEAKLKEGLSLRKTLRQEGLHLSNILVNRARPYWLEPEASMDASLLTPQEQEFYQLQKQYYANRTQRGQEILSSKHNEFQIQELPEIKGGVNNLSDVIHVGFILGPMFVDSSPLNPNN